MTETETGTESQVDSASESTSSPEVSELADTLREDGIQTGELIARDFGLVCERVGRLVGQTVVIDIEILAGRWLLTVDSEQYEVGKSDKWTTYTPDEHFTSALETVVSEWGESWRLEVVDEDEIGFIVDVLDVDEVRHVSGGGE